MCNFSFGCPILATFLFLSLGWSPQISTRFVLAHHPKQQPPCPILSVFSCGKGGNPRISPASLVSPVPPHSVRVPILATFLFLSLGWAATNLNPFCLCASSQPTTSLPHPFRFFLRKGWEPHQSPAASLGGDWLATPRMTPLTVVPVGVGIENDEVIMTLKTANLRDRAGNPAELVG
jgi:hypothetical protein